MSIDDNDNERNKLIEEIRDSLDTVRGALFRILEVLRDIKILMEKKKK